MKYGEKFQNCLPFSVPETLSIQHLTAKEGILRAMNEVGYLLPLSLEAGASPSDCPWCSADPWRCDEIRLAPSGSRKGTHSPQS